MPDRSEQPCRIAQPGLEQQRAQADHNVEWRVGEGTGRHRAGGITAEFEVAEALEHGGRLAEARRLFPGAPEPFIDLSTGINPVPFPFAPPPLAAYTRLPEPEDEAALRAAAAQAYGVADPAMVVAAPGTQLLINLVPRLRPLDHVAILGPTYAEHAAAWAAAGSSVAETRRLADLGVGTGAVVCNPNNPDGRFVPPADLLALADRLAGRGGLLVVDEAFADFAAPRGNPGASLAPTLPRPGLLVLRSFGKAYGLAGIRLGFALCAPALAAELRSALGPWAASGPAIAIARQAFASPEWLDAATARLEGDARRLDGMLERAGLRILGGTRLFRLAEAEGAASLFETLGRAGLLVRRFHDADRRLRFGIPGPPEHWDRLAQALRTHRLR